MDQPCGLAVMGVVLVVVWPGEQRGEASGTCEPGVAGLVQGPSPESALAWFKLSRWNSMDHDGAHSRPPGTPLFPSKRWKGIARGEARGRQAPGPLLLNFAPSLAEHRHHIPWDGPRRSKNRLIMCQAGHGPVWLWSSGRR